MNLPSSATIAVIDYGMGNLRSVAKALEHVAPNSQIIVTNDKQIIANAEKIVFPGVGAVSHCMLQLKDYDLIASVKLAAAEKPFLGICLGMQLLFTHSEENNGVPALDILPGKVVMFKYSTLKIPHIGWNNVQQTNDHPLWFNIKNSAQFYFVHSYLVQTEDNLTSGSCDYGQCFTASVAKDNIFATQFHPEKSQADGLQLLKNFTNWDGKC